MAIMTIMFQCAVPRPLQIDRYGATKPVQETGHRRFDSERMMKLEPLTEYRPVGLQASA